MFSPLIPYTYTLNGEQKANCEPCKVIFYTPTVTDFIYPTGLLKYFLKKIIPIIYRAWDTRAGRECSNENQNWRNAEALNEHRHSMRVFVPVAEDTLFWVSFGWAEPSSISLSAEHPTYREPILTRVAEVMCKYSSPVKLYDRPPLADMISRSVFEVGEPWVLLHWSRQLSWYYMRRCRRQSLGRYCRSQDSDPRDENCVLEWWRCVWEGVVTLSGLEGQYGLSEATKTECTVIQNMSLHLILTAEFESSKYQKYVRQAWGSLLEIVFMTINTKERWRILRQSSYYTK